MTEKRRPPRSRKAVVWQRLLKVGLIVRHTVVLVARTVGPRTAIAACGIWCVYLGAAEIYKPAGLLLAGAILLSVSLRRPEQSIHLDHLLRELLAALGRVGRG